MKSMKMSSLGAFLLCYSTAAFAQDTQATVDLSAGGAQAEADSSAAETESVAPAPLSYMNRYVPEKNMWELGLFGGVMFPSSQHQLYRPGSPETQQGFKTAGEIGLRVAYFPATFLGFEVEGAAMPSQADDGTSAGLWTARGHLIGQIPGSSITPFALIGGGVLGAASDAMGNDADATLHLGLGVKAALDEYLSLRLDVRDTLSQKFGESSGTVTHSPEILLGITFVPHRRLPDRDGDGTADHRDLCPSEPGQFEGCAAPDADKDGVEDALDACPEVASSHSSGCPDSDADGVADKDDLCPDASGQGPGGCPEKVCAPAVVDGDSDGDGLADSVDKCPQEPGKTADGCPSKDADNDGVLDENDKCPEQSETKNGFEDQDGCPDELPEAAKSFDGVMQGIQFEHGSARIAAGSTSTLENAAKVLNEYPSLRVSISGYTDSTGSREANLEISQNRANAVRDFLVKQGVDVSRLETRGLGPDQPIASNDNEAGRKQNRRIEFQLIRE